MKTQVNEIRLYSANGKLKHTLHSTWGTVFTPDYKGKEVLIDGNNGITYKVLVNDITQWPQRHNMLYKIYAKQITIVNLKIIKMSLEEAKAWMLNNPGKKITCQYFHNEWIMYNKEKNTFMFEDGVIPTIEWWNSAKTYKCEWYELK